MTARPSPGAAPERIADWFLDLHAAWFDGAWPNDLAGRRAECRRALVGYLKTGERPPEGVPEGYVVMKYRREIEGLS